MFATFKEVKTNSEYSRNLMVNEQFNQYFIGVVASEAYRAVAARLGRETGHFPLEFFLPPVFPPTLLCDIIIIGIFNVQSGQTPFFTVKS